ncbi:MAG: efflux RND transporter periplasmic adaptor subunit [Sphingobacterium sp.]|nr:efflux RND transporter periplasmic adaptor subunit [Sphingobacterium sp.]
MKTNLFIVASAILCISISCTSKGHEHSVEEKFTVTSPLRTDTCLVREYVSQIRSLKNIEIRAQEKGYLQQIYVDEGQHVAQGQLLFKIMPTLYQAEYEKAKAEVDMAAIELQNAETLASKNIVANNEVKMAKAKYEQAKAEMSIAKAHLSFTEIRAPFAGTINRIPLRLGSLIDEGALLTNLSDNSNMQVYFNVSEREYLDYKNDKDHQAENNLDLRLANNTILPYKGAVELIESEFDNETGNIAFRARFPNPEGLLKNGQTGKVQMKVPVKEALLIPQKATYELQDRTYVFVVDKKGEVHARRIMISGSLPDIYIVSDGLNTEDVILLEGVQKVNEGDKVIGEFQAPRKVLSNLRIQAE